jgi:hypothetical protein
MVCVLVCVFVRAVVCVMQAYRGLYSNRRRPPAVDISGKLDMSQAHPPAAFDTRSPPTTSALSGTCPRSGPLLVCRSSPDLTALRIRVEEASRVPGKGSHEPLGGAGRKVPPPGVEEAGTQGVGEFLILKESPPPPPKARRGAGIRFPKPL